MSPGLGGAQGTRNFVSRLFDVFFKKLGDSFFGNSFTGLTFSAAALIDARFSFSWAKISSREKKPAGTLRIDSHRVVLLGAEVLAIHLQH